MEAALSLRGVSKAYAGARALSDISLDLTAGHTLALIGPSGCGKSTLLRTANGLVAPDSGQVSVHGEPLVPHNLRKLRLRMGYVIQEGGLFPHLTARRNAVLMAQRLGWPRERIDTRLDELLGLVQLPRDLLDRRPGALSGGQRQRVALMRALMLDPELLLLDEPLGALDPMIRYELQEELKAIFARLGKAVLLVTHDMAEAVHFADDLALMDEGRIVQRGTARQLLEQPAEPMVEQFIRAQRVLHLD